MNATDAEPTVWECLGSVPHRVRMVSAGGWRTRVLEAGRGDRTVVLMAGTGGHLEAFARNIAPLADRFRVVAYDYPGHGYSDLTDRDLELTDYVAHLEALLDQLDIARADLMGESLGGWIAVKFAVAHPHRTGRLVLNTPGGTMARPEVMERIRSLSQAAAEDPTEERIRARLSWLMADPVHVTDELVGLRRAIYRRSGFAASMRHVLCLQDPDVRARNQITAADLAGISQPTLVVWTSEDPSGPASAGTNLAAALPHGRFALIQEAGHWPQWEQSARYNELVLGFLDED